MTFYATQNIDEFYQQANSTKCCLCKIIVGRIILTLHVIIRKHAIRWIKPTLFDLGINSRTLIVGAKKITFRLTQTGFRYWSGGTGTGSRDLFEAKAFLIWIFFRDFTLTIQRDNNNGMNFNYFEPIRVITVHYNGMKTIEFCTFRFWTTICFYSIF